MTDGALKNLCDFIKALPEPPKEHQAVTAMVNLLRTTAEGAAQMMAERDTWKERADALLDQKTTPPHVWKAQKAVIEAVRLVVTETGDLRALDEPMFNLIEAEKS